MDGAQHYHECDGAPYKYMENDLEGKSQYFYQDRQYVIEEKIQGRNNAQIIKAFFYGIVHDDIKPLNYMISSSAAGVHEIIHAAFIHK
jgi:hypothetical protein